MIQNLKSYGKHLRFLVFSDHGQCKQVYSYNILAELSRFGLKFGRDYFCFVDATLVLFWPQNETKKQRILMALQTIKHGTLIDDTRRKLYHMNFNDNRFGEIVFALQPGGTFFPNFFARSRTMRGKASTPSEKGRMRVEIAAR